MFKKLFLSLLIMVTAFTSLGTSFASEPPLSKIGEKQSTEIIFEKYLSILPFELSSEDSSKVKIILKAINEAFSKNELALAQKKMDEFYEIVSKYWMSEATLKILLPFESMMNFGSDLFTEEEKNSITNDYKKLSELRKKKHFEEYFSLIKEIHNKYYDTLGQSIGDANSELQLIQYIKGADQLTAQDLVDYTFRDYLEILPFEINNDDIIKGQKIFDTVIEELKKQNIEAAKNTTKQLNNLLAPYWIKTETMNLLVPHQKYREEAIKYLTKKNQLDLNNTYEAIKDAQTKGDFDKYFASINNYFSTLGLAIKEYYNDFFDEIVFIRS